MTRKEARARIRPDALEHALRRVVFDMGRAASLVEDEEELVTPLLRLTPIAVLKG
jgi:tRNA-splicing ligase RtcB (3'-phosphate/5'-hydroxy nucleic acid ligase)